MSCLPFFTLKLKNTYTVNNKNKPYLGHISKSKCNKLNVCKQYNLLGLKEQCGDLHTAE